MHVDIIQAAPNRVTGLMITDILRQVNRVFPDRPGYLGVDHLLLHQMRISMGTQVAYPFEQNQRTTASDYSHQ
jgi:hypothetical protein